MKVTIHLLTVLVLGSAVPVMWPISKSHQVVLTYYLSLSTSVQSSGSESPQPLTSSPRQRSPASNKMKDPHKLRVLTLNACSLKGKDKRLEFQSLIDNYKPDIVNVNETHINDTVFSAEILEKGYTTFCKDRNEFGGGVLSAFSNHLVVTHEEQMDGNYEGIWSKINIAGSKSLFVGSVYRTPDSNVDPLVALDGALCKLVKNPIPNILITGDLNLPSISWEDDNYAVRPNPTYGLEVNHKFLDIVNDHSLTQHVMEPTRGENTLDLVLTTCPEMVLDLVVEPGMSDHDLVLFDLNLKPSFNKKKPRKVFVFRKGNMGAVKTDLKKHLDNYFNNEAYHKLIN
ncbi:uncharacterized protein LOC125561388 [Nematostella vectensis]|uniref:uncharacterized protein LOC125561388 n=1 Tax=Nematostella vectensis TaxID=45351 RepID=UPI0020774425|nr:uncharacterized protein LOC125561388 [Nematostella vectensis]